MVKFEATVPTEHAGRYLQQLCKHWSHRFEVEFDAAHGIVHLAGARCTFLATPQHLSLMLEGGDEADLPRLCEVVAEHLKRFAFREDLELRWTAAASS